MTLTWERVLYKPSLEAEYHADIICLGFAIVTEEFVDLPFWIGADLSFIYGFNRYGLNREKVQLCTLTQAQLGLDLRLWKTFVSFLERDMVI